MMIYFDQAALNLLENYTKTRDSKSAIELANKLVELEAELEAQFVEQLEEAA